MSDHFKVAKIQRYIPPLYGLTMHAQLTGELVLYKTGKFKVQSFSKVAGTPVVLYHNSIDTSFFKQYASPPPPPSPINVGFRNRIELRIKSEKIGCQH